MRIRLSGQRKEKFIDLPADEEGCRPVSRKLPCCSLKEGRPIKENYEGGGGRAM